MPFGTVVTGTLTSGSIQKDQEIEFIPGQLKAKVRGLQVHGAMTQRAIAGQRTAINLQGINLAQVERGMVITPPNIFRSTQILKENLLLKGISREELRKRFYDDLPLEVFRYCLEELVAKKKISILEESVSLHGREVQLSSEAQRKPQRPQTCGRSEHSEIPDRIHLRRGNQSNQFFY
jgi:hypothetical protein